MNDPLDIAQWAKNWEALARQTGEKMAGTSSQTPWFGNAQANPSWAGAFGKSAPFAGAGQQDQAIEHLLAGAQGYLGMLQNMAAAAAGQGMGSDGGFAEALRQGSFAGAFPTSVMNNPLASAMRGFGGQGAQGLDQMMERFAAMAGPFFDAVKGGLNAPAFGHLREKQENMQNAARLMIDYQEQNARYDRLMLKVSEQSFARFQLKLAEREEPGRQVDSVRALYDLWIDAAEEAYAEIALSEEFREVYAAVVDAQMRVRKHVQGEVEKLCSDLGMPTRSEVDSIGQRLQALRREFREEREVGAGSDELAAELDSMRRELAALSVSGGKQAGRTRTAKPAKATKSTKADKPAKPVVAKKPARQNKVAKAAKVSKQKKAEKTSKPGKAAKPARARKAGKPAKATDSKKAMKSAKASGPVKVEKTRAAKQSPEPERGARKSKLDAKKSTKRRLKRRKSTSDKASVVAAKNPGRNDAAKSGSFAASIARFARKSKNSSAGSSQSKRKLKTASRGGSK